MRVGAGKRAVREATLELAAPVLARRAWVVQVVLATQA
jgi:hypothetical protein